MEVRRSLVQETWVPNSNGGKQMHYMDLYGLLRLEM